jgi:hypothetical protein
MSGRRKSQLTKVEEGDRTVRSCAAWLLAGTVVFISLFACGQLATVFSAPVNPQAVGSELLADYRSWGAIRFPSLKPGLIAEAARESSISLELIAGPSSGCFLPAEFCSRAETGPKPSVQPTESVEAAPSPSPTPTIPVRFTPTPAVIVWSLPTPTESRGGGSQSPPSIPTATPTNTPTDTEVPPPPVPADTATGTPTPTEAFRIVSTRVDEPDLENADGNFFSVSAGDAIIIDLMGNPIIIDETPNPDVDLVLYEREDPARRGTIALDFVVVRIAKSLLDTWFTVFHWGDQIPDANTNVESYASDADGELDNEAIPIDTPSSPLVPTPPLVGTPPFNTGIEIDVDSVVRTPGAYPLIMIGAPTNAADPAEVDAVQVIPTKTPVTP